MQCCCTWPGTALHSPYNEFRIQQTFSLGPTDFIIRRVNCILLLETSLTNFFILCWKISHPILTIADELSSIRQQVSVFIDLQCSS